MKHVAYVAPIDYMTGKLPFDKPVLGTTNGLQGRLNRRNKYGKTYATISKIGVRDLATNPYSTNETNNQTRFAAISALVAARRKDVSHRLQDQADFKAQDTYKTLTEYLWAIMTAQYDSEE